MSHICQVWSRYMLSTVYKEIDTTPLSDPMNRWDSLSIEKKHDLAATMIDVVYVSDEQGIEIEFSI